ncbi:MAG: AzlD domain-containing protein [Betaproteobacteria bacterium]|nr:AzlD domain-containing protein [Betaproteobacteria bacterium]
MDDLSLFWLVLACGLGTYLWRGLGVALSGRIHTEGELFAWVGCVAYAMVAGLIARIILLPVGTLAATPLLDRLLACGLALLVFFRLGRNLFVGVVAGGIVLVLLTFIRGLFG